MPAHSYRMTDAKAATLSQCAAQSRAWRSLLQSQIRSAGKLGAPIDEALGAFADAADAVISAQGKAALLIADGSRTAKYKLDNVQELFGASMRDALRATLDLKAAIDKARKQFENVMSTAKPSAAEAAMMPFQAHELVRVLESAGSNAGKTAVQLLKNALAAGDTTQAYLLTGGDLRLTFQRLQLNESWLYSQFSQVMEEAGVVSDAPGAALYPWLVVGGPGTLNGFVDMARMSINRHQVGYNAWLANAARSGVLAGIYDSGEASTIR